MAVEFRASLLTVKLVATAAVRLTADAGYDARISLTFEVVALVGAPTIVAAYSLAQKRWEFQRTELAEARAIIDAAALNISRERDSVHRLLWEWRDGSEREATNQAIDHANGVRIESRAVLTGLVVRLGRRSDVTCRYQDVLDEVELASTYLTDAFNEGRAFDPRVEQRFLELVHDHVDRFEKAAFAYAHLSVSGQSSSRPLVVESIDPEPSDAAPGGSAE